MRTRCHFAPASLVLLLCPLLLQAVPAGARVWRVPSEVPTIGQALEQAATGDVVEVACGTYREHDLALKNGVTLRGASSPGGCVIIDGQRLGRLLYGEQLDASAVVEGLVLTGGLASGENTSAGSGGAIFLADAHPTIRNCVFRENSAQRYGGAIRCVGSSPSITGCLFEANAVTEGGGGALSCRYGSAPSVRDCVFAGNQAAWGGAVSCRMQSSPLFENCLFKDNTALPLRGLGGAVFADYSSSPDFELCTLLHNEAVTGGALALFSGARSLVSRCTIVANTASFGGGGLISLGSEPTLNRVIIAFNSGEGALSSDASAPLVTCSDVFGNTAGDWTGALADQLGQNGNLAADPMFVSTTYVVPEHLDLRMASPCAEGNSPCGGMGSRPVGTPTATEAPPPALSITGIHPNPFNPRTALRISVPAAGHVRLTVHDPRGRAVAILHDGPVEAGSREFVWNGTDLNGRAVAAGVYVAVLEGTAGRTTRKLALVR